MYFEIYQESTGLGLSGGEFRWRLRGGNHEIIAHGEGYKSKANCQHAIELVKSTWAQTPVHDKTVSGLLNSTSIFASGIRR